MTSGDIDILNVYHDKETISKEEFFKAFQHFSLANQEVLEMFSFANIKKDGVLSQEEWRAFTQIFVQPFMQCDYDFDHGLDQRELKICIFKHDYWKRIAFGPNLLKTFEGFGPHENQPANYKEFSLSVDMIIAADRDLDGKINLNE